MGCNKCLQFAVFYCCTIMIAACSYCFFLLPLLLLLLLPPPTKACRPLFLPLIQCLPSTNLLLMCHHGNQWLGGWLGEWRHPFRALGARGMVRVCVCINGAVSRPTRMTIILGCLAVLPDRLGSRRYDQKQAVQGPYTLK